MIVSIVIYLSKIFEVNEMFDFEEELKKLPHVPGVYLMHDSGDHIIYVGKAIDLYNRVHQYFQTGYKKSPKIQKMVSHIAWFEYIVCGSEIEALVLECNLIKEHRPHYNTMLTDDKGYPYIRITVEAVYGLLGVDRGVPEVWGSVYDIRELLDSSVKLMDGKSPLEINFGPLNKLKRPILRKIQGTVIEKVLRDHDIIKEGML